MSTRLRGDENAFWDGATVSSGGTSSSVRLGRGAENLLIYVNSSAAATFVVQVAHSGDLGAEGTLPDADDQTLQWHDLYYVDGGVAQVAPGAGESRALALPAFVADYVRLKCTAGTNSTVTAGWEARGD